MGLALHEISTPDDPERVIILVYKQSLLERMIDRGGLTLSVDRALWALAGIIAALNGPNLLYQLLRYMI
jgi:hypothetical protein